MSSVAKSKTRAFVIVPICPVVAIDFEHAVHRRLAQADNHLDKTTLSSVLGLGFGMRNVLVGLVVASSMGGASAEPSPESGKPWERPNNAGLFLEIGGGWERLHPPNGLTYRAEYLRIAPELSLNHFLYLGAAVQVGRIYSAYGTPDSAFAAIPSNTFTDEGNGSTFAGQVFLGVRHFIGIIAVGGELAPTVRETSAGVNFDYAADKSYVTTIEIHGRVDVWATPHISGGVMAGMDIASVHDFEAGLQVAFHIEPYDTMTR